MTEQQVKPKKCNHVWVPVYRSVIAYAGEEIKLDRPTRERPIAVCMLCGKHQENPFE